MPTGYRAGTHVVKVFPETTTFGTREAGFDAGKKSAHCWDVSANLMHEAIEDQGVRVNLGEWVQGVGLTHTGSEFSFSTYCHGFAAAVSAGASTGQINSITYCLEACTGEQALDHDGDKVKAASVPTVTSVQETTAAAHAVKTIVPFGVAADGKVYMRPVGTYLVDTMTLLMELPTAPNAVAPNEDIIYGCYTTKLSESHARFLQAEALGKQSFDSWEAYGMAGSLSIPQAAPSEAQAITFTFKVGDHLYKPATSQTSPTTIARVIPAAGGEFLIASYGDTTGENLDCLRIGLELGREYAPDPAANSDIGLQGWILTGQQVRLTVVVRANDVPPAACTGATWYEVFANGEYLHMLASFGKIATAGNRFAFYCPKLHLVSEPEHGDTDGIATMTLTFAASQSYDDDDLVWFAQA